MSTLTAAIEWIDHVLLGSVGVAIAILCVAFVGALTMQGHIPVRRGLSTLIGCFVLFGAPVIAAGLLTAVRARSIEAAPVEAPPIATKSEPAPPYKPSIPASAPYDPYAGAAVPTRENGSVNDIPF